MPRSRAAQSRKFRRESDPRRRAMRMPESPAQVFVPRAALQRPARAAISVSKTLSARSGKSLWMPSVVAIM